MRIKIQRITDLQKHYIECLLIDCYLSERLARNSWISTELSREIKFLDELSISEASKIISRLREIKESLNV